MLARTLVPPPRSSLPHAAPLPPLFPAPTALTRGKSALPFGPIDAGALDERVLDAWLATDCSADPLSSLAMTAPSSKKPAASRDSAQVEIVFDTDGSCAAAPAPTAGRAPASPTRRSDPTRAVRPAAERRPKKLARIAEFSEEARDSRDAVALYLEEIGRFKRLTRAQEVELSAVIQSPDTAEAERERAVDQLVTANLRLVVTVCKDFTRHSFSLLDLVSAGNEGLIIAARKFDGTKGVPFANYAANWIKAKTMKAVAEQGFPTRIPPYKAADVNKVVRTNARLMQLLGRAPTAEEVAAEIDVPLEHVDTVLRMMQPALELDAPLTAEGDAATHGAYFGESVSDAEERLDERLGQMDMQRAIARAVAELPEREAQVMVWHFGLNGTRALDLEHIAARLGVTRERARQIKTSALAKLAEHNALAAFRE